MSEDKKAKRKSGDFLAGKGFYIVLFACVAVIGISAWILLFTGNSPAAEADVRGAGNIAPVGNELQDSYEIMKPESPSSEDVFSSQTPAVLPTPETKPEKKTEHKEETTPTPSPETTVKPSEAPNNSQGEDNESGGEKKKTLAEMTFVWPVAGKVETPFSVDLPVYNRTLAVWKVHTGVDLAASIGTKVLAVTDGKVTDVFEDDMMGTTVVIDHGNNLRSVYSNLAATPVAKTGDNVAMGAVIGSVGSTALGEIGEVSHLHLEMSLDGDAVDPASYLPSK